MAADRPTLVALPSLDDLYAAEPEEFVAARNALAKQLKAAGDKDTAAEVAKLRRPPVSAWALNQVARSRPDEIEALMTAAADLAGALADPAGADLRAIQRAFRSAIEAVVRTTLDVVSSSGRNPSPGLQQAIQATLQAAAVDDGIALALRSGVLAEDEPAPGFLFVESDEASPARPATKPATKAAAPVGSPKKAAIGRRTRPTRAAADPAPAETTPETTGAKAGATAGAKAERAAERAAQREADRSAAKERARLETEEREAERRRRARLAELRSDAKRLEKRADRLEAVAIQAEAAAASARTEADEARTEADTVLRALEAAERAERAE
ncbi:MAG: hypothetical protein V9G12_20690 [Microthrixaceae bacterium]